MTEGAIIFALGAFFGAILMILGIAIGSSLHDRKETSVDS